MVNNYMGTSLKVIENILYQNLDFPRRLDMSLHCLDEDFVVAVNVNGAESYLIVARNPFCIAVASTTKLDVALRLNTPA